VLAFNRRQRLADEIAIIVYATLLLINYFVDRMRRFAATVPVLLLCCLSSRRQPQPNQRREWRGSDCCALPRATPSITTSFWTSFVSLAESRAPTSSSRVRTRIIASTSFRRSPPTSCDRNPISSLPSLLRLRALQRTRPRIPIVMLYVGDPVGLGFASSLAHPGGNMTGVTALGAPSPSLIPN
jgi:putative tryptophan/tyrosine transport system substrate-binding protein